MQPVGQLPATQFRLSFRRHPPQALVLEHRYSTFPLAPPQLSEDASICNLLKPRT